MNIQAIHLAGLSPLKQDDKKEEKVKSYKLMPFDKLIIRQQFNESRFKSDAVSPAGAISIAQITRKTFNDGLEKGYVPKGTKYEDLAKDDDLAEQFQRAYMEDLMGRDWNTLGTKSESELVQQVKALAAYNMGPTRLVNILNEMKADGIDIYSDDLVWVEKLPEYHKDTDSNDPIYESMHYVQNIMLGGDEVYERDYERLYNERFPDQIEEEVEEKEESLGTKIGKLAKEKVKTKIDKKTNWWEKWLSNDDSSLKSTNVNPLMGLSPLKDTSDDILNYGKSLHEVGLSPDPGEDITSKYNEDFLNMYEYFDQQYNDGKLFERLSGKEIDKHDMYVGGNYEWMWEEDISSKQKRYKEYEGSGYINLEQTVENIKELMRKSKVFAGKTDEQIFHLNKALKIMKEKTESGENFNVGELIEFGNIREEFKSLKQSYATKMESGDPEIYLAFEQARLFMKEHDIKTVEEFVEILETEMRAIFAHEMGHVGLGHGTEGEEPQYDTQYNKSKGLMSERDFNIIYDLIKTSDNLFDKTHKRTHDNSVMEAYADMMSFRSIVLNEGLYDWRTEDLTREKMQEIVDYYKEKQMPFGVKRFIDKLMVAPDSKFRHDQSDEEYEKRKWDNLIYMNNVIALGRESFSDPMKIDDGTGLDRRV